MAHILRSFLGDEAEEVIAYVLGVIDEGRSSESTDDEVMDEVSELLGAHATTEAPAEKLRDIAAQVIAAAIMEETAPAVLPQPPNPPEASSLANTSGAQDSKLASLAPPARGSVAINESLSNRTEDAASLEMQELMQSLVPDISGQLCR